MIARIIISSTFCVALSVSPTLCSAGVFDDVWGVVTDPLKIRSGSREISSTIDRAIFSAEVLQDEFDSDVRDYIAEMQQTVLLLEEASANSIERAKFAALELEQRIISDLRDVLLEAECALERFATGTFQEAVHASLVQLSESSISVELPFGKSLETSIEVAKSVSPDDAYIRTRDAYLDILQRVGENDPAYTIVSSYQNIAELAFKTHCHYARSGGGELFLREFAEYSTKLKPWVETISVSVEN